MSGRGVVARIGFVDVDESVRVLAALGSPPVDLRTPELLLEIAGSHSGFVLRNVSVLLIQSVAKR